MKGLVPHRTRGRVVGPNLTSDNCIHLFAEIKDDGIALLCWVRKRFGIIFLKKKRERQRKEERESQDIFSGSIEKPLLSMIFEEKVN
jgi:hypothetical protein